jgi:hypothetical protein
MKDSYTKCWGEGTKIKRHKGIVRQVVNVNTGFRRNGKRFAGKANGFDCTSGLLESIVAAGLNINAHQELLTEIGAPVIFEFVVLTI